MRKSKITLGVIVINVIFIALILLLYPRINENEKKFRQSLLKLEYAKAYTLEIKKSYNDRGIMILNEMYFVPSTLKSISSENQISNDIKKRKANHSLSFADIVPPYQLRKEAKNDTLRLRKDGNEKKFILDEY